MQKIEFGDINRFFVSIGLFLIGFALIIPYFYLKEDFGLYLKEEDVAKFDEQIVEIIRAKRNQVACLQKIIPFVSLTLIIGGIVFCFIGIKRWLKRQVKLDEKLDNKVAKSKLDLKDSTPEERVVNAKKETAETEIAEQLESGAEKPQNLKTEGYLSYMAIEDKFFNYFKSVKNSNFDIFQQPKIGNRFFVDILLRAKTNKYSDRIIEIKYFKNQLPLSSIEDSITKLATYISYYKENTNKRVIPILLIVYSSEKLDKAKVFLYKKKIIEYSQGIPELDRIKVEIIQESKMNEFDIKQLLKR